MTPTPASPAAPAATNGIDPRVPRFNQGVTGLLLAVAFLLDLPWLVAATGVVLAFGALFGTRWNLWARLFLQVVKPTLRLGPPKRRKDPAPIRFAMLLGTLFLAFATTALYTLPAAVATWLGWGFTLAVAALALLAAATDLCVGCEIHAYLARWKSRRAAIGEA